MIYFRSRISLLIIYLDDPSVDDNGMLTSPMTTVLVFIYTFRSFRVCLMKLGALILGAYSLIIAISFCSISPFISMEYPSLSHLINVGWKPTVSMINTATPVCFRGPLAWYIFFQPFILSLCLFLLVRWVSCKQQIVEPSFLIQFIKLCLLMGELSPLTLSVSTDRNVMIPVI
jgi:hypothetical protein